MVPRLCRRLFQSMEEKRSEKTSSELFEYTFKVQVRFMEIYNERVKDLLWSLKTSDELVQAQEDNHGQPPDPQNLKVRQHPITGPYVVSITSRECSSWSGPGGVQGLLDRGNRERAVASTAMNNRSSRSHAIFRIQFTQTVRSRPKSKFERPTINTISACLNLVDLAGSERVKKSKAEGQTLTEAASINLSLTTLKMVIDALVEISKGRKKAIPFRDAMLTWLLSDSLGGNSKTAMIAAVSPHPDNAEETVNTLRYASKAREIINMVYVNEDSDARRVHELQQEMATLQRQLAESDPTTGEHQLLRDRQAESQQQLREQRSECAALAAQLQRLRSAHRRAALAGAFELALERHRKRKLEAHTQRLSDQLRRGGVEAEGLRAALDASREEAEGLQRERGAGWRECERLRKRIESLERAAAQQEQAIEAERAEWERAAADYRREARNQAERFQEEAGAAAAKHERTLQTVIRESAAQYDELASERREEAEHAEQQLRRSEQRLADLRAAADAEAQEHATELAERDTAICELRAEAAASERERAELRKRLELEISKAGDEWRARFHRRESELLGDLDNTNGLWEAKYQRQSRTVRELQQRAEQELRQARQEGEQKADQRAMRVQEEWRARLEQREGELQAALDAKTAHNQELQGFLREIEARERKYATLAHRIFLALEHADPSGSADYLELLGSLRSFHAEYTSFAPSKYKLQHMLRQSTDGARHRCAAAPVVGDDSLLCPVSANFFPLQPGPGREESRPPSRGRRRYGTRSPTGRLSAGGCSTPTSRSGTPRASATTPRRAQYTAAEDRFGHNRFRHA
eukprot:TRINITY_DN112_c0_g1_i1.p1 TRINITY_DN112_c0_g1~~TRINITY_DN112_c0_g1_i1.p1  ORF type:complete len:844 (+),score=327.49 TRINITY_DN112_c0_g1_i1:86-2533(+)